MDLGLQAHLCHANHSCYLVMWSTPLAFPKAEEDKQVRDGRKEASSFGNDGFEATVLMDLQGPYWEPLHAVYGARSRVQH